MPVRIRAMLSILATVALAQTDGLITRTEFGVPHIQAPNAVRAMELAGRAVAEDRLWQMEISRRQSRGRLAALLGPSAVASDTEYLKTGYTDEELMRQFSALPKTVQSYFEAYARGVNETIRAREAAGTLPKGYSDNESKPEPWTALDSVAIAVRLAQRFGSGGEGEIRNLALMYYLKGQKVADQSLDVLNDLAWFQDPESPTTIADEDDRSSKSLRPKFVFPTEAQSQAHLDSLPPSNLLELGAAVRLAEQEETTRVAQAHGTPWKMGSYAIVASAERSKAGVPLLLGAPQMGHSLPSIIHEMAISCPEFGVAGMDLPGSPGVLIGMSRNLAWTFTSGVADVVDVYVTKKDGETHYFYGDEKRELQVLDRKLEVRGGDPITVKRISTHYGPVLLNSRAGNAVYSRAAAYQGVEISALPFVFGLYTAKGPKEAIEASKLNRVSFNFFVAGNNGDIGWRFCGQVPVRPEGYDPRLPLVGSPKTDWKGFVHADAMPMTLNPKSGLITNWNNKPVSWWPNFDTPAWGKQFRVARLNQALDQQKFSVNDFGSAAWEIARRESATIGTFLPYLLESLNGESLNTNEQKALDHLRRFDGWQFDGQAAPVIYDQVIASLRMELIGVHAGGFLGASTRNLVLQAPMLERALLGQSNFDYLAGRSRKEVLVASFRAAVEELSNTFGSPDPDQWRFRADSFRAADGSTVLYANRGSTIQIVELGAKPRGRNVLAPGVGEAGKHFGDQDGLAKRWGYKLMIQP